MVQELTVSVTEESVMAKKMPEDYDFLNAYHILDLENLSWAVAIYKVFRIDGYDAKHEDRGNVKDIIWQLRSKYRNRCPGYGFVIDINEEAVVVPSDWDIPNQENFNSYQVTLERRFEASAANPKDKAIIMGILREGLKKHFKDNYSEELGYLWQDYRDFCQMPMLAKVGQNGIFCRKFKVTPHYLGMSIK